MNLKSKKDILVRNLLGSVVPIIAHDASFERRLLERRLPVFTLKTLACHRWPSRCHKPHSTQRSWLVPRIWSRYPKLILPDAGYGKRPHCRRRSGWRSREGRLISLPRALRWCLRHDLDLGQVGAGLNREARVAAPQPMTMRRREGGSAPHLFPNIILRSETRNRRRGQ